MARPFSDAKACVFDAYGTLFDLMSAPAAGRVDAGDPRLPDLMAAWREKQIRTSWWYGLSGHHADFWTVTVNALDDAMDSLEIADAALRDGLLAAFRTPGLYPDAGAALSRLKAAALPTALLSNGTPDMLDDAVRAAGIAPWLDTVLSVEQAGVFKPHPRVYELAVTRFAVPREAIVFVSSNAWDVHAAALFGFRVVWCNRQGRKPERLPGHPEAVIASLSALPTLFGLEPSP